MNGRGARTVARLLAGIVLVALLVTAIRHLDLARVAIELAAVRGGWVALALLLYAAILPLWALQWRLLAPAAARPSFTRMLGVIAMTSSVLNTTPLLLGEAAGVFFLVARAGLSRTAALSVLAMDQLLVGVAKVGVLAGAAWTNTLPLWMERGRGALSVGVGALVVLLVAVAWRAERVEQLALTRLPARPARIIAALAHALAPLRSTTRGGGALLLALMKKAVEVAAIICVARAFGIALSPPGALLVLAALNLATLMPIVPGNVGVYEAAVILAYTWLGVPPERALDVAVIQHACYFVALALPGYRWLARAALARSPAAAP